MKLRRDASEPGPVGGRDLTGALPDHEGPQQAGDLDLPHDSLPRRMLRIGAASVLVVVAVLGLTS